MKKHKMLSICNVIISCLVIANICYGTDICEPKSSFFADDLYPACIPIDSAKPWEIDPNFIKGLNISGSATVDHNTLYNSSPTIFLDPTEQTHQVIVSKIVPVEQGQFYSFSSIARGTPRKKDDLPEYLPAYGFISIRWLDANGKVVPVRDKLMSRPSGEQDWHIKNVNAMAPSGAVKAKLTIKVGSHIPQKNVGMWFADIKWHKAMPTPVSLEIIPRVLQKTNEEFTIRIERRAQYSLGADFQMHIEMLDKAGNVIRNWMTPNTITLPWSIKTKLPKSRSEYRIRVKNKPIKKYAGAANWELSEPILISDSNIDAKFRDGKFIVKDKRTLILGCYHAQPQDYAILKDAGINTILFKSYDAEEALGICDSLNSLGMYGISHVGGASQTVANKPRVKGVIEAVRDHKALLAFSLMDEPTRKGIGPREIAWFGCWVQSLAPKVPTITNYCGPYTFDRYATTTDIFSSDPYPVYIWGDYGHKQADLRVVSQWNNLAKSHIGDSRGCITVIETFSFDKKNKPPATGQELRNMVYQTLCNGITSIMYYSVHDAGWYLPDEPIFKAIKQINSEISELEKWFVHEPVQQKDRLIEILTDNPDELISNTWKNDSGWLSIIINLSREDLKVQIKHKSKLTCSNGKGMPDELVLSPLEVRVIRYNIK